MITLIHTAAGAHRGLDVNERWIRIAIKPARPSKCKVCHRRVTGEYWLRTDNEGPEFAHPECVQRVTYTADDYGGPQFEDYKEHWQWHKDCKPGHCLIPEHNLCRFDMTVEIITRLKESWAGLKTQRRFVLPERRAIHHPPGTPVEREERIRTYQPTYEPTSQEILDESWKRFAKRWGIEE